MASHVDSSADVHLPKSAPHVLLVPFPSQGHTNPSLSLARYLAANGINITLVQASDGLLVNSQATTASSEINGDRSAAQASAASSPPFIRIETIPSGFDHSQPFSLDKLFASVEFMRKRFIELLHKLMLEVNAPSCLLINSMFGWGDAVAAEFCLPRVDLWTSSASSLCYGIHTQDLVDRGFIPPTEEGAKDKIVDFLPGLSPFRIGDLPRNLLAEDGIDSTTFTFFMAFFQNAKKADRIIVNTMYELETSVIDALRRECHVPLDPVGPLYLMSMAPNSSSTMSQPVEEDKKCLAWLDKQNQESVLYIAFGSIAAIGEDGLAEIAYGLEASGEAFLWVIRRDAYKDKTSVEEVLPEGFIERTRERGLVISWAPQLAVLGHSSVGAFLTHCGWNSILESLSNGVGMLGFPQMAEQNNNLKLIVHDWKVGLPLSQEQGDPPKVDRVGVKSAITTMMKGDEGLQVRTHARKWKAIAQKAIHGSSKGNLEKLVNDLKHGQLKQSK